MSERLCAGQPPRAGKQRNALTIRSSSKLGDLSSRQVPIKQQEERERERERGGEPSLLRVSCTCASWIWSSVWTFEVFRIKTLQTHQHQSAKEARACTTGRVGKGKRYEAGLSDTSDAQNVKLRGRERKGRPRAQYPYRSIRVYTTTTLILPWVCVCLYLHLLTFFLILPKNQIEREVLGSWFRVPRCFPLLCLFVVSWRQVFSCFVLSHTAMHTTARLQPAAGILTELSRCRRRVKASQRRLPLRSQDVNGNIQRRLGPAAQFDSQAHKRAQF